MSPWKAYFVVLLVTLPALIVFLPANSGFPLDDAWIYTVVSGNLRESGEWAFNRGETAGNLESPALAWFLGLLPREGARYLFREILAAYAVSILFAFYPLAATLPHLFRESLDGNRRFRGYAAVFLSILTLSHGVWLFHLLSGLETCVSVSMGVLALLLYSWNRRWLAGLALSTLILVRIEGYLLALVLIGHGILSLRGEGLIAGRLRKQLLGPVSTCAYLATGWVLFFRWRLGGSILPTMSEFDSSRFAGGLEGGSFPQSGFDYIGSWVERFHDWYWMNGFLPEWGALPLPGGYSIHFLAALLDLMMGFGAIVVVVQLFSRNGWGRKTPLSLLAIWTLLHNLYFFAFFPFGEQAGRHQAINFLWPPLLVAIGGQTTAKVVSRFVFGPRLYFARSSIGRWSLLFPVLLAILPWVVSNGVWGEVLTAGINRINGLNRQAGTWSKKHLPPDARVVAAAPGAYKVASGFDVFKSAVLVDGRGWEAVRRVKATYLFLLMDPDDPEPSLDPEREWALEKVFEASLHDEIGIDRKACQNKGTRCAIYRIVNAEEETQAKETSPPNPLSIQWRGGAKSPSLRCGEGFRERFLGVQRRIK